MIVFSVFTVAACGVALFFDASIIFKIGEWEIDHSSPFDLCCALNTVVRGVRIDQTALALLSVVQLRTETFVTLPILVICVILFVFAYPKKNRMNRRYFGPSTMVRESNRLKIAYGGRVAANTLVLL
jgi:hypothetical protein